MILYNFKAWFKYDIYYPQKANSLHNIEMFHTKETPGRINYKKNKKQNKTRILVPIRCESILITLEKPA